MLYSLCILPLLLVLVSANVEKVIFVAPEPETLPQDASIDNLLLSSLSETTVSIRTYLNASFPTEEAPKGTETWMLLEGLVPGRRYEVRVCWLATQPTAFWLYTHTMQSVFDNPDLLSAVTTYAFARHASMDADELLTIQSKSVKRRAAVSVVPATFLFLQVLAAADYYTLNKTLMEHVPPVHADVILDPFLLNILPKSLLPTGMYLMIIAVVGWFLSGWLYDNVVLASASPAATPPNESKKDD